MSEARLREIAEEGSCQVQDEAVLIAAAGEIARLRSALSDRSAQIAELQTQVHALFGIEQRAERAEAELADAREEFLSPFVCESCEREFPMLDSGAGWFCKECQEVIYKMRDDVAKAEREIDGLQSIYRAEACARAERAEADLNAARDVLSRSLAWADDFDISDAWTVDARAFLERPVEAK